MSRKGDIVYRLAYMKAQGMDPETLDDAITYIEEMRSERVHICSAQDKLLADRQSARSEVDLLRQALAPFALSVHYDLHQDDYQIERDRPAPVDWLRALRAYRGINEDDEGSGL